MWKERKQTSKGHLLPRVGKGQDWLEHGNRSGLVRDTHSLDRSEVGTGYNIERSKSVRGAHLLERVEIGTGQDMERKLASNRHLQTEENRYQDWLGYGRK